MTTKPFIDQLPEPPFGATLPETLRWAARQWVDKELLIADGQRLSFAELEANSAKLARGLLEAGVGKGAHVGVLMGNSPAWLECFFAVTRIGAVAVPLSTFFQPPELRWVAAHADLQVLLAADTYRSHDYLEKLEAAFPELTSSGPDLRLADAPFLRAVYVWGEGARSWTRPTADLFGAVTPLDRVTSAEAKVTPADRAVIVYTSGSTSEPKGVVHAHGAFVRHTFGLSQVAWPFDAGDRIATTRPFFWIAGLASLVMFAIHRGACIVCLPDLTYEVLAKLVVEERLTGVIAREAWLRGVMTAPPSELEAYRVLSAGYCMGALARPDAEGRLQFLNPALEARLPADGPPLLPERSHRGLGMTELIGPLTHERTLSQLPEDKAWSCGRAVPGLDLMLRDVETGDRYDAGEGELLVRGTSLTVGLYKKERAEIFTADGYYPTGDIVRLDADGYVFFQRRHGEMIKVRSANVAPAEVEMVLNQLPGIVESAVFALGEEPEVRLAAIVVPAKDGPRDPVALKGTLRGQLSSFKVPEVIYFATAADLPRTGSGKIQRAELASCAAALAPAS